MHTLNFVAQIMVCVQIVKINFWGVFQILFCFELRSQIQFCRPNFIYFQMAFCLNQILLQSGDSLKFRESTARPSEEGLATSACSFEKWRLTGPKMRRFTNIFSPTLMAHCRDSNLHFFTLQEFICFPKCYHISFLKFI